MANYRTQKNAGEPWLPRQRNGNCYPVFRLRMEDGTVRDEHPEHLYKSEPPQPMEAA